MVQWFNVQWFNWWLNKSFAHSIMLNPAPWSSIVVFLPLLCSFPFPCLRPFPCLFHILCTYYLLQPLLVMSFARSVLAIAAVSNRFHPLSTLKLSFELLRYLSNKTWACRSHFSARRVERSILARTCHKIALSSHRRKQPSPEPSTSTNSIVAYSTSSKRNLTTKGPKPCVSSMPWGETRRMCYAPFVAITSTRIPLGLMEATKYYEHAV
jgi:hypothetical protein